MRSLRVATAFLGWFLLVAAGAFAPTIGKPAPDFALADDSGRTVTMNDFVS